RSKRDWSSDVCSSDLNYINSNADALTNNGGNDTIAAVTAMGYDAYYVALEALKAAGSTDPAAIKAALAGVTYDGVSGHIAFDERSEEHTSELPSRFEL